MWTLQELSYIVEDIHLLKARQIHFVICTVVCFCYDNLVSSFRATFVYVLILNMQEY